MTAVCAQHGAAASATCARCGVFICGRCSTPDFEKQVSYCPPCGERMVQPLIRPSNRAYTAVTLGVLGLHCLFPLGIAALVLASQEQQAMDRGEAPEAGRGFVRASRVLGWINVAMLATSVVIGVIAAGMYWWWER